MKVISFMKVSVLVLTLMLGSIAVAHADEVDDFVEEYANVVEMYEGMADKNAFNQSDVNKFNESMMSLSQKAGTLQSSGKQMSPEQAQKLNDLAMRMSQVFQKMSQNVK